MTRQDRAVAALAALRADGWTFPTSTVPIDLLLDTKADALDVIAERDSLRAEVAAAQLARDTYHARLTNIVDEAFGMQPTMSGEALMTFLESRLFVARAESDQSEARIRAEERVLVEHEIANWMRGRSSMDDVYIDENELSTIADAIEASDYREDET
jgi:hypothetical protein